MVVLTLKVVPKASRDAIVGWHGDALKVAVTAAPERGKANAAVVRVLADALDLAPSSLSVIAGASSRHKRIRIDGLDAAQLSRRLPRPAGR